MNVVKKNRLFSSGSKINGNVFGSNDPRTEMLPNPHLSDYYSGITTVVNNKIDTAIYINSRITTVQL